MNRAWLAASVTLVALGTFGLAACANDVQDPLPPAPTVQPAPQRPEQSLSNTPAVSPIATTNPVAQLADGVSVPEEIQQKPDVPRPQP